MQSKAKTNAKLHAGNEKESLGQVLYRVFIGIIFGFANIIPGVSGGTAMVVFGVYERIILFITDIRHRLKHDWKFFLPIGIGMAISILFFGSVMDVLLQKHEALMQTFFIGVIVFSVPMIFKEAFGGKRDRSKDLLCAIIFLVVLALMVVMAVLKTDTDQKDSQRQIKLKRQPVQVSGKIPDQLHDAKGNQHRADQHAQHRNGHFMRYQQNHAQHAEQHGHHNVADLRGANGFECRHECHLLSSVAIVYRASVLPKTGKHSCLFKNRAQRRNCPIFG